MLTPHAIQGHVAVPGQLRNLNTLESFVQLDKPAALQALAGQIWADICSGAAEEDPALLWRFLVLSFADLKKYSFTYWRAPHRTWSGVFWGRFPRIFLVFAVPGWRCGAAAEPALRGVEGHAGAASAAGVQMLAGLGFREEVMDACLKACLPADSSEATSHIPACHEQGAAGACEQCRKLCITHRHLWAVFPEQLSVTAQACACPSALAVTHARMVACRFCFPALKPPQPFRGPEAASLAAESALGDQAELVSTRLSVLRA